MMGMYVSKIIVDNHVDFLKELKTELPYDLLVPLMGIYIQRKSLCQGHICMLIFIV